MLTASLRALPGLALLALFCNATAAPSSYDATYRATFQPGVDHVEVELELAGEKLPSKIALRIDPKRYGISAPPIRWPAATRKWCGSRKERNPVCVMSSW